MNHAPSLAASLEPNQRQKLALKVLARQEAISTVAEKEGVSRKFLYQQGEIAKEALNTAFEKPEEDSEVIYHLPVTQKWLFQLVLGLIVSCHSSYRGVVELLRDLFDYPISVGTIKNRVGEAVEKARKINQAEDLKSIEVGLLDEIFQGEQPVLAGVDCSLYLLFPLRRSRTSRRKHLGLLSVGSQRTGAEPCVHHR